MNPNDPALQLLIDRVRTARSAGAQLCIRGGGSKDFYGEAPQGELLDTRVLEGTSSYEPTELVVTTRCGTALAELEALLATKGQCLPFEPPHFAHSNQNAGRKPRDRGATVGGMVAAGLSGPSRAAVGSVRDHVLGVTLLNGRGEVLTFGGQVMKNVAGYDVSRLLAGSMGTLGVILEVSLKVMPIAPATLTLRLEMDQPGALAQLNEWGGLPLPLNASAWLDGNLIVRLRGALAAVQAARVRLGGAVVEPEFAGPFWDGLRHHDDEFFANARGAVAAGASLWRLSLPSTAAPLPLSGELLIEWGGAQRWLCSALPASVVRDATAKAGGHATLFAARDNWQSGRHRGAPWGSGHWNPAIGRSSRSPASSSGIGKLVTRSTYMTWLIGILSALLFLYVVMCLCGMLLLCRLVFAGSGPLLFPLPQWESSRTTLTAPDGTTLSGWEIHRPDKHGPPVLYFGGNAEQVGLSLDDLMLIDARWIATYSYRGYGMSSGLARFSNTATDGLLMARRLAEIAGCQTSDLVVMGRSLGAAIAVQVAAGIPVSGLILISPFSCLSSMVRRMAPWFPRILVHGTLNSLSASQTTSTTTLFVLAEDDDVIPPAETQRLYNAWNGPKSLTRIPCGGHNGLHEHESYHNALNQFLRS